MVLLVGEEEEEAEDYGDGVQGLVDMGFGKDQAREALRIAQGNVHRAAEWLLR